MIKEAVTLAALVICAENKLPPEPEPSIIAEMAVSYYQIEENTREIESNLHMMEVLLHKRGLIELPEPAVVMARNKE